MVYLLVVLCEQQVDVFGVLVCRTCLLVRVSQSSVDLAVTGFDGHALLHVHVDSRGIKGKAAITSDQIGIH